jgi:hypothetical protein
MKENGEKRKDKGESKKRYNKSKRAKIKPPKRMSKKFILANCRRRKEMYLHGSKGFSGR